MTIKELLEQMQDVELTEEQEKQIKEYLNIKESKKWRPKEGEKYFYLDDCGDIDYNTFDDDSVDAHKLATGNFFKTEEDANYRLEQIKVYNELKNFADENNEEIDWKDTDIEKIYLCYNRNTNKLERSGVYAYQDIGQIYFSSRELADQIIAKIGTDRIKKYLFGVE